MSLWPLGSGVHVIKRAVSLSAGLPLGPDTVGDNGMFGGEMLVIWNDGPMCSRKAGIAGEFPGKVRRCQNPQKRVFRSTEECSF